MNLAILGSGKIVKEALFALQPVETIQLQAIFARPKSREKAEKLAEEYRIPQVFTDYEALLGEEKIDTVYVGLVNQVHYDYAKKALLAGKHVILEKPFTESYSQARELADLALQQDRFLFEAITVLHNPVFRKMQENLQKLGPIRMVLANFSQYSSRYDRYLEGIVDPCFDPDCLGGALRDINVYNIHYAVGLFGAPLQGHYYPNLGFNGIDISGTAVLEYEGFSAICTGAKDSDSSCFVSIQGEKGWMKIDGKTNVAPNLTITYLEEGKKDGKQDASGAIVRSMTTEQFLPPKAHHRMTEEFQEFARIIEEKDREAAGRYLQETLQVMAVLDQIN